MLKKSNLGAKLELNSHPKASSSSQEFIYNRVKKIIAYKILIIFCNCTNESKTEVAIYSRSYHPYRILIIWCSGSRKTNVLLNVTNNQPDIDKIYLYAKDPYEAKYQDLINKQEKAGLKHYDDPKALKILKNTI